MQLRHLAVIMDGNGRFAQNLGEKRSFGHERGAEKLLDFVSWCAKRYIPYVTFYGFSSENWQRSQEEVGFLMTLMIQYLESKVKLLLDHDVRLKVIGNINLFDSYIQEKISAAVNMTQNCQKMQVNLALSYSGRDELVRCFRKMVSMGYTPSEIDENLISEHLDTAGCPDPDLILRTSGELRLSNFLLWQAAYTEFYFSPKHWPEFTENDLDLVLEDYAQRSRRFGRV